MNYSKQSQSKMDAYLAISFWGQGLLLDLSYKQILHEEENKDLFTVMARIFPEPLGRWWSES